MPTGPVVVLVATLIFVVSILFAPTRGARARARARMREGAGGAVHVIELWTILIAAVTAAACALAGSFLVLRRRRS